MTTAVQNRRGTTAEHAAFTGLEGELTIDTTKDTAVIHDGTLAGGYPLAKENLTNVTTSGLSSIDGASTASDDKFFIYDQSATSLKTITRAELNNAIEQDALANVAITGGTINGTTIGATTAAAVSATTLTTSSTVTLSGGTANGVAYLNGSKVLTTGSALTFDGTSMATTSLGYDIKNANALMRFYNGSGTRRGYLQVRSDAFEIWSDQASVPMVFGQNNSEQMRLTSTGLGIGTSSPDRRLDVRADPAEDWQMRIGANNTDVDTYDIGRDVSDGLLYFYGNQTGYTGYVFSGIDGERMRITSAGNLGIGTSSPAYKLDVTGTINSGASSATGYNLVFRTSGITTGRAQTSLTNTSGDFWTGIEGSTAGQTLTGSAAYSAFAGTFTANPLYLVTNSSIRATLDSSGNLGLGVAPSAWFSNRRAMQIGGASVSVYGSQVDGLDIYNNGYNASGTAIDTYTSTGYSTKLRMDSGQFRFFTAPSGTAGDAISFSQSMTLDASGNLAVGTTDATGVKLKVQNGSNPIVFLDGFASAGTLGVIGANPLAFYTNGNERARIDSSGNLIQTVNTTAATLATNNTLTFSIVDNSTLRISVRGSDGTTRTATVALT